MSIGIPIKILHEAEGHIITVETNEGEVYRGKLVEAEDNMNSQLVQVSVTHRDGRVSQLDNVFIRGSKVRFMILPDMLKNAPMLKKPDRTKGAGVGKSAILRAQAARGRGRARGPRGMMPFGGGRGRGRGGEDGGRGRGGPPM
ncbi:putative Small nuclear ribonucleoprotein Sm D3 [Hypsibius exemplaris]|uniref:Small nuclear ribonucleoprotein Sm D3 n=1 Tax=Hypsibius exemplaris TaxID=2072580 RepID=A0A9X6NKN3_HYPEX|nr:putative Small nuclear ribonucleoprotein Sm D3 [Hypsibius exemplaris]